MASPIQIGVLSLERRPDPTPPRITRQDSAAWLVGGKGFFDEFDKLHSPGQMLYYDGEPNIDLFPLNKLAWERKQEFLDKINLSGEKKAKKDNKEFKKHTQPEWSESGEIPTDIKAPENVMGFKKTGGNQQIR